MHELELAIMTKVFLKERNTACIPYSVYNCIIQKNREIGYKYFRTNVKTRIGFTVGDTSAVSLLLMRPV